MKLRIRKSSTKARRQHGYRAKPGSYTRPKTKKKNTRLVILARKKRKKRG